jgi:hypothetical protein
LLVLYALWRRRHFGCLRFERKHRRNKGVMAAPSDERNGIE